MYEGQMIFASVSVVCSTYTMAGKHKQCRGVSCCSSHECGQDVDKRRSGKESGKETATTACVMDDAKLSFKDSRFMSFLNSQARLTIQ